jgi:hypothetical protein
VANLRKLFANDMKLSVDNITFELGKAPESLKTCLNESVEASKVNYKNALTKYTNCLNHAENVAMAAKLAVNLTKIMTEAGNVSECDELRFNVIGLQTKLATIQENSKWNLTLEKQIIDGVKSVLSDLEMKLLDCKYFANYLGLIKDALQQQQELESIVSDVSNVEYLIPLQSQITSINLTLTNVVSSPSLNPKQKTIFMLKITQSTIDQIKSYVNVSKSNSNITHNYESYTNYFQNMTNAIKFVYSEFYSCIFKSTRFSSDVEKNIVTTCFESIAGQDTIFLYDQLNFNVSNSEAMVGQLNNEIFVTLQSGLSFVETHSNLISWYVPHTFRILEKNVKLIGKIFEFFGPFFRVLFARCYGCLFLNNRYGSESEQKKVVDCLKSCLLEYALKEKIL